MFGYTSEAPQLIYKDLVDAFRLNRIDTRASGPASVAQFTEYIEKVKNSRILPEWWQESVHVPGVLSYAKEDEWGRLDREVSMRRLAFVRRAGRRWFMCA